MDSTELAMREQPHGGFLRSGNPGNTGRPRSAVRALARDVNETALLRMQEMLDDKASVQALSAGELARVAEVSGRFGLGEVKEATFSNEDVIAHVSSALGEWLDSRADEFWPGVEGDARKDKWLDAYNEISGILVARFQDC